jgi:hypothetical protein
VAAALLAMGATSAAQTPAAAAPLPRTADGKPDLSGFWQVMNTAAWDIQDHQAAKGVPAGQGVIEGNEIPYQPWALARKNENYAKRAVADPEANCYLLGVPRIMYAGLPFQIVQTPGQLSMFFEYAHSVRFIFMNGAPHPQGSIDWWMGDSRGRWEGDTLVVDVRHLSDRTWLDRAGNFHSEAMHVVERYTPMGPDHINYEVTIEDPKVFTRPWKMSMLLYRHKERNFQLLEYECYTFDYEQYYPYPSVARPQ